MSLQLTALGLSGSGKTCFLHGMYFKMCGGINGYTLKANDDDDVSLRRKYEIMRDPSLGKERFPMGTDSTSEYNFELQYAFNPIMEFKWTDYPGGILDSKTSNDVKSYQDICQTINDSSTLFIFVDGALLAEGEDNEERADIVRDECAGKMNHFISEYAKTNDTTPPIAIVVTKYDLCMNECGPSDIEEVITKAFEPMFLKPKNQKSDRAVAIIPVSLGRNITDNDFRGKLRPINVELPIFMGIGFALKDISVYKKSYEDDYAQKEQNLRKLASLKEKEEGRWFFKDNDYIRDLSQKIHSSLDQMHELELEYNYLEELEQYRDSIREYLNSRISMFYRNGEKRKFEV